MGDCHDEKKKLTARQERLAAYTTIVLLLTVGLFYMFYTHGCSVEPKKEVVTQPAPPVTTCGSDTLSSDRKTACPAGQTGEITEVCRADGWKQVASTCTGTLPDCERVTTFDELQPVIALNCSSCHAGYDSFEKAANGKTSAGAPLIDEMIRRTNLDQSDNAHMPAGRSKLSSDQLSKFTSWKADGLLRAGDCAGAPTNPTQGFKDFGWLEETMFTDAARRQTADQEVTRYLVAIDQVNLGRAQALTEAFQAANKAVNSISVEKPQLFPLTVVAPGVWRINDIDDLGIQAPEWKLIEDNSQLQFESFTQRGLALKNITKSRLPWMFVQDFNDTVLRNATVYYKLTEAPATLQELTAKLGVDFAGDLLNFRALLVGFNGSALSPAANRLISRHDSRDGGFWATYDTGPIVSDAQSIRANPLLKEAGGRANLKFAAGEQLYTLPNGLIGSFLADFNGKRLDQADPAVVHDFTSNPVSPIIKNAISCFRCHNGGFIPAVDQVRASAAASGLGPDDIQRVLALFKVQSTIDGIFSEANSKFSISLRQLGVDPTAPDPISKVSDRFLGDAKLEEIAAQFVLPLEDFKTCLSISPNGKLQAGQLLNGGTLSHDQLIQVVADLKRDCRIFQDPLAQ